MKRSDSKRAPAKSKRTQLSATAKAAKTSPPKTKKPKAVAKAPRKARQRTSEKHVTSYIAELIFINHPDPEQRDARRERFSEEMGYARVQDLMTQGQILWSHPDVKLNLV